VPQLRLVVDDRIQDPAHDAAVTHALMLAVAAGDLSDTLRISRPGPSVAFGKRDVIAPGYRAAAQAALAADFTPIERLAGGRAAAFHDHTIHLTHAFHDPDPRTAVTSRFDQTATLLTAAFRTLGIDAHIGEIQGEYCPGDHSINARHRVKLAGLGQRVVRNGGLIGAVVVVDDAARIRSALLPVYAALDLPWRPDTTGSLATERPGITWTEAVQAIEAEYAHHYELEPATADAASAGGVGFAESGRALHPGPQNPSTGPAAASPQP
jgi:octanoyl-[GcvH]:protein N-octanoyltransferase